VVEERSAVQRDGLNVRVLRRYRGTDAASLVPAAPGR
jgi:hypothetical protein